MPLLTGSLALLLGAFFVFGSRGGVRAVGLLLWLIGIAIIVTTVR